MNHSMHYRIPSSNIHSPSNIHTHTLYLFEPNAKKTQKYSSCKITSCLLQCIDSGSTNLLFAGTDSHPFHFPGKQSLLVAVANQTIKTPQKKKKRQHKPHCYSNTRDTRPQNDRFQSRKETWEEASIPRTDP